jgi:hypothetical protein
MALPGRRRAVLSLNLLDVAPRGEAPIRRLMLCCAPWPYAHTVCGRAPRLKHRLGVVGCDGACAQWQKPTPAGIGPGHGPLLFCKQAKERFKRSFFIDLWICDASHTTAGDSRREGRTQALHLAGSPSTPPSPASGRGSKAGARRKSIAAAPFASRQRARAYAGRAAPQQRLPSPCLPISGEAAAGGSGGSVRPAFP